MRSKFWIIVNAIGLGLYICLASGNWSQENVPILFRTGDDVMRWLKFCLPMLALYVVFNAIWLVVILLRIRRIKSWAPSISWALIMALWVAEFKYDRYRFTRETAPLSQQEEDEIARDQAAAQRWADERAKRVQAEGIPPSRVDGAGGRYYYFRDGTSPSVSGSDEQNLLEHGKK
jgi:hypothetical protein